MSMPRISPGAIILAAIFIAIAAFLALNVGNLSEPTGKVVFTSDDIPTGGANAVAQTREFEIVNVLAFDDRVRNWNS